MVIKLIKRELKDSGKYYVPMQVMILTMFVIFGFMVNSVESGKMGGFTDIITGISALGLVAIVFGLVIMGLLANIYILYTSIYGDRGYDLFTMPVSSFQIISSKLLTIILWSVVSMFTASLGIFVFTLITGTFKDFLYGLELFITQFKYIFTGFNIEDFFFVITQLASQWLLSSVLMLLVGAIVNTSKIQKNRGVIAVVLFYVINMALGMIDSSVFGSYETMTVYLLFKLTLSGVLIYLVAWLWEHKLEIL